MVTGRRDAIVIGCGPAGSVVAALLSNAGYGVTVIDRGHDRPEETMVVTPPGREALAELGWLDSLAAGSDCRPAGLLEVAGAEDGIELAVDWTLLPRRWAVGWMAEAAGRSGAELLHGWTAVAPVWQGRRVVGVRVRDPRGTDQELLARVVVDASGRGALLPHQLGHVLPRPGPRRVRVAAFGASVPGDGLSLVVLERQWIQAAVIGRGRVSAVLRRTSTLGREDSAALESDLRKLLEERWGELEMQGKARVVGLHLRSHAGDGWVAVGEAGGCGGPGLPSVTSTGLARAASAAWEVDLALRSSREVTAGELGATVTLGRQTVFLDSYLERVLAKVAAVGQLGLAAAQRGSSRHLVALLGGEWTVRRGRVRRLLLLWRLDRRARRELRRRRRHASVGYNLAGHDSQPRGGAT